MSWLVETKKHAVRFFFLQGIIEGASVQMFASSCGSGTLPSHPKAANSSRRPRRTASTQLRITVAGEVLEGRSLAIFFAHKQHGHKR